MKYIHMTDIHLDHLGDHYGLTDSQWAIQNMDIAAQFARDICEEHEDVPYVCLTGDISSGQLLPYHIDVLGTIFQHYGKKLFFVCGNHDFYGASFKENRSVVKQVMESYPDTLYYLTDGKSFYNDGTLVVGHDGWYDGMYAPFTTGTVEMNDFHIIEDLKKCKTKTDLFSRCRLEATKAANHVEQEIEWGILSKNPNKVLVLTHIPPFQEMSTYKGNISNPIWLPCYSSKTFGDMLLKVAHKFPEVSFKVLCGHTHDRVEHLALPNLRGYTGYSKYGFPEASISIQEF
jgi:predicted phosphohydrolase